MGGKPTMGGTMTYGTRENNATVQLQKNLKISYGQKVNGNYSATPQHTATDVNGRVKITESVFSISGSTYEALQTVIGSDNQLTESDLISLQQKTKGKIKNVTNLGNGIYEVEYKLNPGSEAETAFMQFDFETDEERAVREEKEAIEAEKKQKQQAEAKAKKEAEAKKAEEDRYWKEECNDPISKFLKWLGF